MRKFNFIREEVRRLIEEYDCHIPSKLAKQLDILITYTKINKKGLSFKCMDNPVIILDNSISDSYIDREFVIAHELYHILYHDSDEAFYFKNGGLARRRDNEDEANYFAYCFLFDDDRQYYYDYENFEDFEIREEVTKFKNRYELCIFK